MTNREANQLHKQEWGKPRAEVKHPTKLHELEVIQFVEIEEKAETNPEIWDEEFVPMFPVSTEETKAD